MRAVFALVRVRPLYKTLDTRGLYTPSQRIKQCLCVHHYNGKKCTNCQILSSLEVCYSIILFYYEIYKHLWLTNPPISTKRTTTPHLKSLTIPKTMKHAEGNSDSPLAQAQTCGGDKSVNDVSLIVLLIIRSSIRVITKVPNTKQSSKEKGKTHMSRN